MDTYRKNTLGQNLEIVRERIIRAAIKSGRDPDDITLVVVTKGHSAVVIKALYELGVRQIGESYLKEALFKQELLGDYEIDWHMIGSIQSGKVRQIANSFNTVHSVDRISLANNLEQRALQIPKNISVYLELNLSGEKTKSGWSIKDEADYPQLIEDVKEINRMSALTINGIMTMAPYSSNPEDSRQYFQKMRFIRDVLMDEFPQENITGLSMGMSGDFEVAIEEGATVLRIGTAIIGER